MCKIVQENFPQLKNKVTIIYNIVAPSIIYDLSKEEYAKKNDSLFLITLLSDIIMSPDY